MNLFFSLINVEQEVCDGGRIAGRYNPSVLAVFDLKRDTARVGSDDRDAFVYRLKSETINRNDPPL